MLKLNLAAGEVNWLLTSNLTKIALEVEMENVSKIKATKWMNCKCLLCHLQETINQFEENLPHVIHNMWNPSSGSYV